MAVKALVFLACLGCAASHALAQSLGDVAKAEEARRKAVKTAGKVFTNDSLKPVPPPATGAIPVPSTTTEKPAGTSATPAAEGQAQGASAQAEGPRDEAYWRKKIETERTALARAQTFVDALQSRVNALNTDFVNRDDPQQRSVIAADRQKALAELEKVKQEIQDHQANIIKIQEDARKAGAPAGWVR